MTPNPDLAYSGGISLVGAAVPKSPPTTTTKLTLQTPSTPRIDISRASSSSHHEDSRDSSPERELFEGQDPSSAKLGLGFREEGKKVEVLKAVQLLLYFSLPHLFSVFFKCIVHVSSKGL